MIRPPPRSTPTDTLFPYTTLFLSVRGGISRGLDCAQVPPCDRPREPRFPVVHPMKQRIHYVPANDGVRLAWAEIGRGPGLVKAATWLTHLQDDLDSPIWSQIGRAHV